MKARGLFRIEYINGFVQAKYLIDQSDYDTDVVPTRKQIDAIVEVLKLATPAVKPSLQRSIDRLKTRLTEDYGKDFFTTGSPLHGAIETGCFLLPEHQGGLHVASITKIN